MTHQEGRTRPNETCTGIKVGCLLKDMNFFVTNLQHLLLEAWLPRVKLQNFDSIKHFVHEFHTLVFVLHLFDLKVLGLVGDDTVNRN